MNLQKSARRTALTALTDEGALKAVAFGDFASDAARDALAAPRGYVGVLRLNEVQFDDSTQRARPNASTRIAGAVHECDSLRQAIHFAHPIHFAQAKYLS